MKELICIVCPKGCHLYVDEENNDFVTGNSCPRGAAYGQNEIRNPQRTLTSTVRIQGAAYRRSPVKTNRPIPKSAMLPVMKALDAIEIKAPVRIGDTIVRNVCESGADIVATRNL